MNERIIEIEADSLEEARRELHTSDRIVLEESIICGEKVDTIEEVADSVEEAFEKATSRIPAEARIEESKTRMVPKRVVLYVEGFNEESVANEIRPKRAEVIESITLLKRGRKGFLGFFKTANVYEVVVFQQALVHVSFRIKARVQARVRGYLGKDLLESIQELRQRDLLWEEILQVLNPKKDDQLTNLLNGLLVPDLIDPISALSIIESKCRNNEGNNWRRSIEEAHIEASGARKRLRIELRGLDQELADVFMFYSSIDWYPPSGREPTGIPMHTRPSWGRQPPNEVHREIIPRYSTDSTAFMKLERRAREFGAYDFCEQFLAEQGQEAATATLKQKCFAILKARRLQLKRGRE
jgi:hypothetical protein